MKKFNLFFILLMMGLPLVVSSCSSDEDDKVLDGESSKNQSNEYVAMGYLNISPIVDARSAQEQNYDVNFNNEKGQSMLHFNLIKSDDLALYGCDMDGDEKSDFYVEFTTPDMNSFFYLDKDKKVLQECSLTINQNGEFVIDVLQVYNTLDNTPITRAESWSDCFSRRMGSALGITMSVLAGFIGPEGSAAVAAAGAISCAVYDPF